MLRTVAAFALVSSACFTGSALDDAGAPPGQSALPSTQATAVAPVCGFEGPTPFAACTAASPTWYGHFSSQVDFEARLLGRWVLCDGPAPFGATQMVGVELDCVHH